MDWDTKEPAGNHAACPGGLAGHAPGSAREIPPRQGSAALGSQAQRHPSEQTVPDLLTTLREFLITLDRDGIVRGLWSSNRAAKHELETRLLGKPLWDVTSAGTFEWMADLIAAAIETDSVKESQYPVELDDGSHTFSLSVIPVAHEAGGPKWVRLVARDVTQQARDLEMLKHSEAVLAQAEQLAELGSWEYDLVNNRVTWSAEMRSVFGMGGEGEPVDADVFWQFVHPDDREAARKNCAERIAERRPFEHETRFLLPDGRVRTMYTRAKPVMDSAGRVVRMLGVSQDITERKEADRKLRESEALLAQAEELANAGCWELDIQTDSIKRSANLCRMLGVDPADAVIAHDLFWQILDPEDHEMVRSTIDRAMVNRLPYEYQARFILPDGRRRTLLVRGKPIVDSSNRVVKRIGVALDVTERAEAARALQESEERYRDLVENSHDLMCTHDLEGRILSMNELPARILGYGREDIIGQRIPDMLDPEFRPEFQEYLQRIQKEGFATGLMALRTRSGERRIWEFRNTLRTQGVPAPIVRGMARDVTEQKEAERKLRKSEALLAQAEQLAKVGSWELDVVRRALHWSSEYFRMLGLEPEQGLIQHARALQMIHPDDRERADHDAQALYAGAESFDNDIRFIAADGRVRTFHSRGVAVRDATGQLVRIRGMSQDITERKEAETRLQESEALLAQAGQLADVGSWQVDIDKREMRCSAHFYRMLGLEPIDAPITLEQGIQMIHPDDRELAQADIDALLEGRELDHELRFVTADGAMRKFHSRAVAIPDASGRIIRIQGMAQDVTAKRGAEDKLRASQALLAQAEKIANFGSWEGDVAAGKVLLSEHLRQMYSLTSDDKWSDEMHWDRMHPKDRERIRELSSRAVGLGEPFAHAFRYLHPEGGVRVHFAQGVPVIGAEGKVVRWIGVIQDITDRARSEEELRRLTQELMRARDDDRRHMARELHGSAGQSLAALKMSLGRLRSELPRSEGLAHELLSSAIELADGAIREVRTVSYLMHPPMLDEAGLAPALRWYADGFAKRSGIQVRVEVPENVERYSQEIETTTFRIVQEALTNVHRYSGSRTAKIRLQFDDGRILAEISDDGCGLPLTQAAGSREPLGVGIASMRERVKQLNGTFEIESSPGRGTTVRVTLPSAADERAYSSAAVHEPLRRKPKPKARAGRKARHASRRR